MAEWSKATDSSSVLFGGVGSNPTGCRQKIYIYIYICIMHSWPSGLRRCVQVAVSSDAWVRIPQNAKNIYIFLVCIYNYMLDPGFEPGSPRPQRGVLTSRLIQL